MLNKFLWRIKYVIYGQRKCPIGMKIWWAWSDTGFDEFGEGCSPKESAQEEIYMIAADC